MNDVMDKTPVLEITRRFAAPPERVYAAWTDAEAVARWLHPQQGMTCAVEALDVCVGGAISVVIRGEKEYAAKGEYRVVEPNRRLVFTWIWQQGGLQGLETEIELRFAPDGDGTRFDLIHRRLPSDEDVADHNGGWSGALDHLAAFVCD